jgi:hypothetical protein
MLSPLQVLQVLADNPAVMSYLDAGPCTLEHVSRHVPDGADERLDTCPCERVAEGSPLGEGQYVSSERHTVGDLVRDALDQGGS